MSDTKFLQKTCAEFFAGIGLMGMGLARQAWRVVFAHDICADKRTMFLAQEGAEHAGFALGDVHQLDASEVPNVTLATASFPCNDLSLAGARRGLAGENSGAFWGFMRVLEEMETRRPPMVLLENVAGFLTSHGGKDFREALLALNSLGYSVDAFILDAAHFVPQSRQRLFVVGSLGTDVRLSENTPSFYQSEIRPAALAGFIMDHPEIAWKIRDLPAPPTSSAKLPDILEDLPETASEWWSADRVEYLLNQMSERHRAVAEKMIQRRVRSFGTVFRRVRNGRSMAELRTDGIAGCLRTPRGGSGRQILFQAGYGKYAARLLTPRECARLMGADDFAITVPLNQALFGFGDAVCVPVISWIAAQYLDKLINELNNESGTRTLDSAAA